MPVLAAVPQGPFCCHPNGSEVFTGHRVSEDGALPGCTLPPVIILGARNGQLPLYVASSSPLTHIPQPVYGGSSFPPLLPSAPPPFCRPEARGLRAPPAGPPRGAPGHRRRLRGAEEKGATRGDTAVRGRRATRAEGKPLEVGNRALGWWARGWERWRRGEGAAPVSKLKQRASGFVMRKGRVSSCMEVPPGPAVSLRMWEMQRDAKVKKIIK